MFNSLREMASNAQGRLSDTYSGYMAKDDLEKVLVEATANENWNISNSKLLQISDATYNTQNVERVASFLYLKLEAPAPQWRRVLKSLTAIEFIIKNGSPPAVIQFKRDMYKISTLCNFSYTENMVDRGHSVREKINLIIDMLSQENRLFQERAEAYEYRKKFYPGAGPTAEQAGVTNPERIFSNVFQGGYGGGAATSMSSAGVSSYGGGAPTSMPPQSSTYNQGFGSNTPGMSQSSFGGGGAGLGSSSQKVYSPYGGNFDGGQNQMGSAQAPPGNVTSMGSMSSGGPMQGQQQSGVLTKTVNMVSSLTTTITDSAGAVSQAMGLKSSKKGILGNPGQFTTGNQYPANYNPPTSISSETYHTTQSQSSFTASMTSVHQSQSGFKSSGGPWGAAGATQKPAQQQPQSYDKPFPSASAKTNKAAKQAEAPKKESKKQMREVETESSDEYGEEFVQPKTRQQKQVGANLAQSAQTSKSTQKQKAAPAQPQPTMDLLDIGSAPATQPAAPAQPQFAFDFMSGGGAQPPAQPQQPVDLFNMGSASSTAAPQVSQRAPTNVMDLLGSGPAPAQPASFYAPPMSQPQAPKTSDIFCGLSVGGGGAPQGQTAPSVQASSGFNFMSASPAQPQQQKPVDPFAPQPQQQTQAAAAPEQEEAQKSARYVPKNKDSNDAWVKGAEFIDLVGLGVKGDANAKPKEAPLIIKPNQAQPSGFQPMAHLNEQQQQQIRLQQMQAQFQQLQMQQQNSQQQQMGGAPAQQNSAAPGQSAFGFM